MIQRPVLFPGALAIPRKRHNRRAPALGDLCGAIRATGVHYIDLVGPRNALQALVDVFLLIFGRDQNGKRDGHSFAHLMIGGGGSAARSLRAPAALALWRTEHE